MRTPHTHCQKGKRVRVKLRSGEIFVDKFVEHHGTRVHFEGRSIPASSIRAFTIYKPNTPAQGEEK